ncbi:hypothetical protein [Thiothrix unzii]|uniref:hypothetical protein n=1 Tax=Thiothrix unzii TaxID=111769 RepID=UPI002A365EBC|nr:hypothetical protein [Thiothrix unzii]MDX9987467.1 hypothetical protein [Thiothrix unzii]
MTTNVRPLMGQPPEVAPDAKAEILAAITVLAKHQVAAVRRSSDSWPEPDRGYWVIPVGNFWEESQVFKPFWIAIEQAVDTSVDTDLPQVLFNGRCYPVRRLNLSSEVALHHFSGWGTVDVSTLDLEKALMNDDGEPVSDEAQTIDDEIFYYIEPHQMAWSDERLEQFLIETVV